METEKRVIVSGCVVLILIGAIAIGVFAYADRANLEWKEYAAMAYGFGSALVIIFGLVLIKQLWPKKQERVRMATTW